MIFSNRKDRLYTPQQWTRSKNKSWKCPLIHLRWKLILPISLELFLENGLISRRYLFCSVERTMEVGWKAEIKKNSPLGMALPMSYPCSRAEIFTAPIEAGKRSDNLVDMCYLTQEDRIKPKLTYTVSYFKGKIRSRSYLYCSRSFPSVYIVDEGFY